MTAMFLNINEIRLLTQNGVGVSTLERFITRDFDWCPEIRAEIERQLEQSPISRMMEEPRTAG